MKNKICRLKHCKFYPLIPIYIFISWGLYGTFRFIFFPRWHSFLLLPSRTSHKVSVLEDNFGTTYQMLQETPSTEYGRKNFVHFLSPLSFLRVAPNAAKMKMTTYLGALHWIHTRWEISAPITNWGRQSGNQSLSHLTPFMEAPQRLKLAS